MSDIHIYGLDIETDTRINGLDHRVAPVTEVAIAGEAWSQVLSGDEREILVELERFLGGLVPGVIATWNGGPFDMPFLFERYALQGIATSLRIVQDPSVVVKYAPLPGHEHGSRAAWGTHRHVDISDLYKETAARLGVKHSLKPVYHAVTGEKPIELERDRMHIYDEATRKAYAASDSTITRTLALRLPTGELESHVDRI